MGTTSEKLTYLNETKQELKQAINNLGGEITSQTTFRNYVSQLENVYDNLPKTSFQEGTEINLGKTIKGKLDFDNGVVGIGQSSQDGTPTPDTPIEIKSVTGNQDVVVSGKNLFDGELLPNAYNSTTGVVENNDSTYRSDKISVKNNGTYYLSGLTGNVRVLFWNNTTFVSSEVVSIPNSFTTKGNIMAFQFNNSLSYNNIQLKEGSTATPYEPYITPTSYQLSLGDIELCGIGDYKDELVYDVENDKVYKYEKIGKINIDGTQGSFSKPSTNRFNIDGIITDYKKLYGAILCMSNYYKAYAQRNTNDEFNADVVNTNYAIELTSNAGANAIRIKDTRYDDITEYQTWLSNNIVVFYYVLATPTLTEITDTTLINQVKALYNAHSNNGTTIITSNGDLPLIIKCRALKGE